MNSVNGKRLKIQLPNLKKIESIGEELAKVGSDFTKAQELSEAQQKTEEELEKRWKDGVNYQTSLKD